MGVAQMEQLDSYIAEKRQIAARYAGGLGDLPGVSLMPAAPWADSTYWLYTVLIDDEIAPLGSREVLHRLGEVGIQTRPLWTPIHLNPAHNRSGVIGGEVAEDLHRKALSLPCSVGLTEEQQQVVISFLRGWLQA
jgi:dTDP-4-amino-4,6-dideoxygalactose transaminase